MEASDGRKQRALGYRLDVKITGNLDMSEREKNCPCLLDYVLNNGNGEGQKKQSYPF